MTKVKEILVNVGLVLEDEDNNIWSRDEIMAWINDAVIAVINRRPETGAKSITHRTTPGAKQALPEDAFRLIRVDSNSFSFAAINEIPMSLLDQQIPQWRMPIDAYDVEFYCYDITDPMNFYIYPALKSPLDIELIYSAKPQALTDEEEDLPLKDDFKNAVIDWVLYRCYSKDDQNANAQRAMMHLQAFEAGLGKKTQIDASIAPNMAAGVGISAQAGG